MVKNAFQRNHVLKEKIFNQVSSALGPIFSGQSPGEGNSDGNSEGDGQGKGDGSPTSRPESRQRLGRKSPQCRWRFCGKSREFAQRRVRRCRCKRTFSNCFFWFCSVGKVFFSFSFFCFNFWQTHPPPPHPISSHPCVVLLGVVKSVVCGSRSKKHPPTSGVWQQMEDGTHPAVATKASARALVAFIEPSASSRADSTRSPFSMTAS